jgi:hypothetical protein
LKTGKKKKKTLKREFCETAGKHFGYADFFEKKGE